MADSEFPGRWVLTLGYVAVCGALMFTRLLPLDSLPPSWAGPDLIICVTMAWMLRRPDSVPMIVIAAVALMADFLFQRPPDCGPRSHSASAISCADAKKAYGMRPFPSNGASSVWHL